MALSLIEAASLASGIPARTNLPSGTVLQVVHTAKTSTFSGTSVADNGGYYIDVTGLSASITPTTSTSKILVFANLYVGSTATGGGYQQTYRLKRTINGTTTFPILGDLEGSRSRATGRLNLYNNASGTVTYRMAMHNGVHHDSPSTVSAITYQVQIGGYSGASVVYLNRAETFQAAANDYDAIPVSTLTLMEIAA
jgi:hypothetical protein